MTTTTMHLRSPGELIAAVPYIIGFTPADASWRWHSKTAASA